MQNSRPRQTAEVVEGRELAKGNTGEHNRVRTQCRVPCQRALDRSTTGSRREARNG